MMNMSTRTLSVSQVRTRLAYSVAAFLMLWLSGSVPVACAQGLLWKLPEGGGAVHFQGDYVQTLYSAADETEPTVIKWIRDLEITCGATENVERDGRTVPCRRITFNLDTRKESVGDIEPSPTGPRVYEVLLPESAVIGTAADKNGIPVSHISILEGTRKIGDNAAEPIQAPALQIYPTISLLRHYQKLEPVSNEPEGLTIPFGSVSARQYQASETLESTTSRSVNDAKLWRSDDLPFGVAQWEVTIVRERKGVDEPRSAFRKASTIQVTMKAQKPK